MKVRLIKDFDGMKKGYISFQTNERGKKTIEDGYGVEYDGPLENGENADRAEAKAKKDYEKLMADEQKRLKKNKKKEEKEIQSKASGEKLIGQ